MQTRSLAFGFALASLTLPALAQEAAVPTAPTVSAPVDSPVVTPAPVLAPAAATPAETPPAATAVAPAAPTVSVTPPAVKVEVAPQAIVAPAAAEATAPAPQSAVAPSVPVVVAPVAPVPVIPAPVVAPPVVNTPVMPTYLPYGMPMPGYMPAAPQAYTPVMVAPAMPTNPWMQYVAPPTFGTNPMFMMGGQQATPAAKLPPYTMRGIISQDQKKQLMGMALPMMTGMMGMQMPDSMNYFANKVKAKKGLSFDEVRDSLFLRANQLNVKKVGENLMWKDFQVVLEDKDAPRIEVYSFCDIAVGRELLKISPEFVVFLPCRIAVMEDANKDIWILMIDWNPDWVVGYRERLGISDALWDGARDLYKRLNNMMQAAAEGDI